MALQLTVAGLLIEWSKAVAARRCAPHSVCAVNAYADTYMCTICMRIHTQRHTYMYRHIHMYVYPHMREKHRVRQRAARGPAQSVKHACPDSMARILGPSCIPRTNFIPCHRAACQTSGRWVLLRRQVTSGCGAGGASAGVSGSGWTWRITRAARGCVPVSCCVAPLLVCVHVRARMRVGTHRTVRAGIVHHRLALGV